MTDISAPTPAPAPSPTPAPAAAVPSSTPTPAPVPGSAPTLTPAAPAPAVPIAGGLDPASPTPTPAPTAADFPTDWREKMAGEDAGLLSMLKRHTSPQSVADWLRKTQLKMSAGELKEVKAPPKDATPEQMETWRKEQGLPDKPETYMTNLKFADGTILGEGDKPIISSFAKRAMESGLTQENFNSIVGWWYETQDQQAAQRATQDQENRLSASRSLDQLWGPDRKANNNALLTFWQDAPKEVQDTILGARTMDGRVVGDIPEVADWFARLSRELNPAATLLPAGSGDAPAALASRKAAIEATMYVAGKPNPAYWSNEAVQKEYRDIIDAEQTMKSRAA